MVKFPGAYRDTDAYAKFSIYGGRMEFPFPGPAVWNGAGSSSGQSNNGSPAPVATMVTVTKPAATAGNAPVPATNQGAAGGAAMYGQCGGNGWTGPKSCAAGKCVVSN